VKEVPSEFLPLTYLRLQEFLQWLVVLLQLVEADLQIEVKVGYELSDV